MYGDLCSATHQMSQNRAEGPKRSSTASCVSLFVTAQKDGVLAESCAGCEVRLNPSTSCMQRLLNA
jgi:hypothetical protein